MFAQASASAQRLRQEPSPLHLPCFVASSLDPLSSSSIVFHGQFPSLDALFIAPPPLCPLLQLCDRCTHHSIGSTSCNSSFLFPIWLRMFVSPAQGKHATVRCFLGPLVSTSCERPYSPARGHHAITCVPSHPSPPVIRCRRLVPRRLPAPKDSRHAKIALLHLVALRRCRQTFLSTRHSP